MNFIAHSIEVWDEGTLIGGLYGVLLKQVFFAESMFSRKTDASKMALAQLVEHARSKHWKLIDSQFHTDHLASPALYPQISHSLVIRLLAARRIFAGIVVLYQENATQRMAA